MEQFLSILPELVIGISTAIGTVIGVLKTNGSKLDKLDANLKMVSLDIQRLTLHDENLSIEERITAGDRYIKGGGNGVTIAYYEKLLAAYKEELKLRKIV